MHKAGRMVILPEELVTMLEETASTLVEETGAQDLEGLALLPQDLNTTVTVLDAFARYVQYSAFFSFLSVIYLYI